MTASSTPPPPQGNDDHRPSSSSAPRRDSMRDNAAFPALRGLNETLPSPPQYTRDLQPGQVRLSNPTASTSGPSRIVGFQPLSRAISGGGNATSSSGTTDVPRSALTSARPPHVRSSTSFGDLHPPRDIHDEFKYLHMGDRKMKVVITQGVGPGVGRFGKEGRPKPRRVMVNEVGGRVEGFVEVGKVDGCVGLDVTVTGRSLCTLYYNGQPSLLDGRRLIKHRITLFPSSDTPPVTNDKGRGKATEPVIPHYTTYSFGFDFPRYCELEESREGPVEDDDDDYPVEKHATEPSSFGTRAIEISHSMGAGRRPSLGPHPAGSFGKEEEPAGPSSAGLSPSSWKNRMESRSPPTTGFGFGNFLKRNSFSAHSTSTSHHSDIGTPDEATGKRGFLRRLSTSQSVSRPPLELQYDLPPSTNLMLGDVQAEIEYQIKIRLRRKGLRFNDSIVIGCTYEPEHSMTQLERFCPFPDAIIHPEYPQWQSLPLEGGHPITHKGKRGSTVEACESAIHAELLVPFPLLFSLPPTTHYEIGSLPTVPFRFRFHSSLPYQFPLLTFASSDTAEWKIHLIRVVTVRLHQKELIRSLPLKTMWTIDTIDEVQPAPSPQRDHVVDSPRAIQARSPPSRQIAMPQAQADRPSLAISPSNHHSPGDISNTGPDQAWQAPPSSFETIEEENLATPPPEFAETYTGPSNLLAPFPPENSDNPAEENVYVTGKISLCRSSFRSILAPLNTPEIVVEYFLDVAITPKSGSVKESFTPLKQRWPVMYERL